MQAIFRDKKVLSWALYDWGNSAYATCVLAAFFPAFYKEYWSAGLDASISTFHLGVANSTSSLMLVVLAPVLGSMADSSATRKWFLGVFALLGISMTAALYFVAQGHWLLAISIFAIGNLAFSGANIFYDALLVHVAPRARLDVVSAYGYALGYLGGGVLFAVSVAMLLWPEVFGLANKAQAVRVVFLCVAVWWLLFSLPLFINVPEPPGTGLGGASNAVTAGFRQLRNSFREIRKLRVVMLFLIAYWLYIDGVDTIVRMAVDFGMSIGFDMSNLLTALLITQFVAFPAAIGFGYLGERIGAKAGILIAIGIYIAVTIWASTMQQISEFYVLAVIIGLVQGGVQSLSRSLYARIIPANKSAEYFGFYNMLGKFAAVLGPLMVAFASVLTGDPRKALLTIVILFVAGGLLLWRVDEREGARMAQELARL